MLRSVITALYWWPGFISQLVALLLVFLGIGAAK